MVAQARDGQDRYKSVSIARVTGHPWSGINNDSHQRLTLLALASAVKARSRAPDAALDIYQINMFWQAGLRKQHAVAIKSSIISVDIKDHTGVWRIERSHNPLYIRHISIFISLIYKPGARQCTVHLSKDLVSCDVNEACHMIYFYSGQWINC